MRRRALVVRIDELVLHGVDPEDRERVAQEIERALAGRTDLRLTPRLALARRVAATVARSAR